MSIVNWKKHADRQRMQRQGVDPYSTPPSRDALRREADRLLAGYTGPVTKVAAGIRVTGSQVSAEIRSERASGNIAGSVTGHVASEKFRATGKTRKSKGHRPQRDLFGAAASERPRKFAQCANIDRAVPSGLVIYCDGCCEPNPGAGGWGFVVYRDGVEFHSECGGSDPTTNNIMELTGALMTLRWLATRAADAGAARLFCDSMYVVNGCNDWRHGWKRKGWQRGGPNAKPENRTIANLDLWKELDAALTAVPIELEWVKGHVGIIGNERADELSLEGREAILTLQPDPLDLIREQLDYSARGGI